MSKARMSTPCSPTSPSISGTSGPRKVIGISPPCPSCSVRRRNGFRRMSWEDVAMMPSDLIAPHLQAFFAHYLCQQKRLSPHTIVSCRDTFRLLLTFVRDQTGIEPSALRIADLDAPTVLRFLDYLEEQRGNSVRSRNIRLAAIRSFFRLVALRDPDSLGIVTRVLAIPRKREDHKLIGYLTRPEIQALLAAPDQSTWSGRRDHALLLTLYNSGARVSEVMTLQRAQVCF